MLTGRIQIIALVLALTLGAGWTCAVRASNTDVPPRCPVDQEASHGDVPSHPAPCRMMPCRSGSGPVVLPDIPALRIEKQAQIKICDLVPADARHQTNACLPAFKAKAWAFVYLPTPAPPQFMINCAFLC